MLASVFTDLFFLALDLTGWAVERFLLEDKLLDLATECLFFAEDTLPLDVGFCDLVGDFLALGADGFVLAGDFLALEGGCFLFAGDALALNGVFFVFEGDLLDSAGLSLVSSSEVSLLLSALAVNRNTVSGPTISSSQNVLSAMMRSSFV